jgi:hypothetical protein
MYVNDLTPILLQHEAREKLTKCTICITIIIWQLNRFDAISHDWNVTKLFQFAVKFYIHLIIFPLNLHIEVFVDWFFFPSRFCIFDMVIYIYMIRLRSTSNPQIGVHWRHITDTLIGEVFKGMMEKFLKSYCVYSGPVDCKIWKIMTQWQYWWY